MPIEEILLAFFNYFWKMNFSWVKTNRFVKTIFPNYIWDVPNREKKVYLTFDDGPTPEITEWTLAQLKSFNAKATFFCIGDNVRKFPEIFDKVIKDGHSIGNHTFNHLNGWKTEKEVYIKNVELCNQEIAEGSIAANSDNLQTELFRPPYGKIKPSQSKILRRLGYKIIMWDVISYDFDASISPEKCLNNVLRNVKPGSIIVFHDSKKAFTNLEFALPRTLQFLNEKGFVCDAL